MERIYKKAIKTWGIENQIDMFIEECSEAIVALQHFKRGRIGTEKVCEELADVEIMSTQMRIVFSAKNIDKVKTSKLKRLIKRAKKEVSWKGTRE